MAYLFFSPAQLHQQVWDIWVEVKKLKSKRYKFYLKKEQYIDTIQRLATQNHFVGNIFLPLFCISCRGFQCLCRCIWTGVPTVVRLNLNHVWKRANRGHLNAGDDNMFAPACIDYVTSFSLPPFLSHTHLFFTLSFFCSVFFPFSLSPHPVFSSGCYISIMQPLPASEEERIRPTLPSVIPCQPRLYILSRHTKTVATVALHKWSDVDRIIINGRNRGDPQWTHKLTLQSCIWK